MDQLDTPQGRFGLVRRAPTTGARRGEDPLRAWDAADEYVLHHLAEGGAPASVTVMNPGPGAVPVALAAGGVAVTAVSDSYVDHRAMATNAATNDVSFPLADPLSLDGLGPPDVVVVKVPRSAALLEDELCRLRPLLGPDTVVVGAGMTKHVHSSTVELFERIVGPTTTTPARKKARLILSTPALDRPAVPSPWPTVLELPAGDRLVHHANVFSRERLDQGTRLLLANQPITEGPVHIVDLGCGDGVLGLAASRVNPEAHVTCVDESFMAVASAAATFEANAAAPAAVRFVVGDGLEHVRDGEPIERGCVDIVLNNPPFHDDRAVGDAVAWQMFTESHRALRSGGELWVVGNRHLAYHAKLKRIFRNCDVVASDPKFVVYRAVR